MADSGKPDANPAQPRGDGPVQGQEVATTEKGKPGALVSKLGAKRVVTSLLDEMIDGQEYASLFDVVPKDLNVRDELRRAIKAIEIIRKRPLIVYAANVIKSSSAAIGIDGSDDLPFSEMVAAIPSAAAAGGCPDSC